MLLLGAKSGTYTGLELLRIDFNLLKFMAVLLCLILYYLSHARCQYTKSWSGSDHTFVLDDIL
jgi:hypothetical protein